jgi:hypothetical protein
MQYVFTIDHEIMNDTFKNDKINGYIDKVIYVDKKDDGDDIEENISYYYIIIIVIGYGFEKYKIFGNSYVLPEENDLIECVSYVKRPNGKSEYDVKTFIDIQFPIDKEHCYDRIKKKLKYLPENEKKNINKTAINGFIEKMETYLWKHNELINKKKLTILDIKYNKIIDIINNYIENKDTDGVKYIIYVCDFFCETFDIILDNKHRKHVKKTLDLHNIKNILTNNDIKTILFDIVDIFNNNDLLKISTILKLTDVEKKQIDILKILYCNIKEGHTCVLKESLINGDNGDNCDIPFDGLINMKKIIEYNNNVILFDIFQEELNITQCIQNHLSYTKENDFQIDIIDYCDKLEQKLNNEQKKCIEKSLTNGLSIIRGFPGVGKTQTAIHIAQILKNNNRKVIILGPTGKVVLKIINDMKKNGIYCNNVHTVHRYINMCCKCIKKNMNIIYSDSFSDVIIIDETSMMSNDLICKLFDIIGQMKTYPHIVFMGDTEQINPIGYGLPFSYLIKSKKIPVTFLKEQFRGSSGNDPIKYRIKDFRECKTVISSHTIFNENNFKFVEVNTLEHCKKILCDLLKEMVNRNKNVFDDVIIITPTKKNIAYFEPCVKKIINDKSDSINEFNVGDYIMMKKNIYIDNGSKMIYQYNCKKKECIGCNNCLEFSSDINIYNGMTGKITKYNIDNDTFNISVENSCVTINSKKIKNYLSLSYINTVHKYQGSESKHVYVIITRNDKYNINWNMIYTAISRSQDTCTIIAEKNVYEMGFNRKCLIRSQLGILIQKNVKYDNIEEDNVEDIKKNIVKEKYKKKHIPKSLKTQVWNYWIGKTKGVSKCLVCNLREIEKDSFNCGHIISEHDGGILSVNNLKPICGSCNSSMGTMNMHLFMETYNLGDGYMWKTKILKKIRKNIDDKEELKKIRKKYKIDKSIFKKKVKELLL